MKGMYKMNERFNDKVDKAIKDIEENKNIYATGRVVKVNKYNVEVTGLNDISFYEAIEITGKASGYVMGVYPNKVIVSLVSVQDEIVPGDIVYALKKEFKCKFSPDSIGKVIDIFGNDLIAGKKFEKVVDVKIENKTTPIMDRAKVQREFLTGIAGIDLMYPIGKGQRQLIIGDKKTGKSQIVLDAIVNQKGKKVLCIYVAIGKTKKEVKDIYYELTKRGAASYTIIVASFNDELPTRTYLTPYVATSIAESFMMKKYDVLVVFDDLKKHADVYREISLMSKKTPGRDAYPADIFYTHSRLLEKGAQHICGGSITMFPIVETKSSDITDYISTNIISICDGQLVLSSKNFARGEKPAIDYGLSVSRLGGNVQTDDMKKVGSKLRRELLSYLEVRDVYELANIDEMSKELQKKMRDGKVMLEKLKQYKFSPRSKEEMKADFQFVFENDVSDKKEDKKDDTQDNKSDDNSGKNKEKEQEKLGDK
ncbi:MAG: F0F1 ATP synthase subunit alpha [Bacilli bacterium]|nr:F0F1 ATP synthase subunit alpha [Bacilli bacterium]